MIATALSLALLTAVEISADASRVELRFDAPVAWSQSMAAGPARMVLEIEGAGLAPDLAPASGWAGAHLSILSSPAGGAPGLLRVEALLPADAAGRVQADGSTITITRTGMPVLIEARPAGAAQGGIIAPTDAVPQAGVPARAGHMAQPGTDSADYVIGPEDLLEVSVFELPELKTTTRVQGDGTVSLPLLGVVQAGGLTKTGLEARLRDMLEERFLLDPQVTIAVSEYRSRLISVIGAVTKPGTYQMIGSRTVLQMISEAGGLTKEAGADLFIIRRAETGEARRLSLDLDDLVIRGNPELNLPLQPGDVVNVPIDRPVYVFVDGAVRNPGQVEGRESRPITLLQAVARAGGLTERANLRDAHVLRQDGKGGQQRIPVNLRDIRKGKTSDLILQEGDVVVIPETFF